MIEEGKISTRQHCFLIFCLFSFSMSFGMPHLLIMQMKQDFWQPLLVAYVLDAGLGGVLFVLGMRYPKQTIIQYSETILGPWLGKLTGLSFAVFFIGIAALILHLVSDILNTILMPETPILVFSLTIILVSAYAVNAGLEIIARLSEIVVPVILLSFLTIIVFSLKYSKPGNLLPIFQHSLLEAIKYSLLPTSLFGICITMGMFMAYHNIPKKALKAKWLAISIGVGLTIIVFMQIVAVLGANTITAQLYDVYRLSQMVKVGDIIERLESLIIVTLISGGVVAISALYWSGSVGIAQIFRLNTFNSVTPFTGGAILLLSLFAFDNVSEKNAFIIGYFPYLALFVEIFNVLLLLGVSFLRHGKKTIYVRKQEK